MIVSIINQNHSTCAIQTLYIGAVIGLEQTFYNVSESEGLVELCVIVRSPFIECPITLSFSVILSTTDGSAGIIHREYGQP